MNLTLTLYTLKTDHTPEDDKNENYIHCFRDDLTPIKFPDFLDKYKIKKEIECYDWDKFKEDTGIDVFKFEFQTLLLDGIGRDHLHLISPNDDKVKLDILLNNVPKVNKLLDVMYYSNMMTTNIKYNKNFDDNLYPFEELFPYYIFTKEKAIDFMNKYCENDYKEIFQSFINQFEDSKTILKV